MPTAKMPARHSLAAALFAICAVALNMATVRGSAQETLVPGARSSDCRSALRTGLASCAHVDAPTTLIGALPGTTATGAARNDTGTAPGTAAVTEIQIDAFLQQYGKPPREAVRALLDPSDDNIRAWLRARRRTLDVARYLADRMSALETHSAGEAPATAERTDGQVGPSSPPAQP